MFHSPSVHTSRPSRAFTQSGFRDWKHSTGANGRQISHNNCHSAWQQFKASSKSGSVADQLGTLRAEQIKRNNHYMITISDVIRLCCRQKIGLRGHDESPKSSNRGNFLDLVARHDQVIDDKLRNGPKNAKYTSHMIQNQIISIMASQVRQIICTSVHKAGFFQ